MGRISVCAGLQLTARFSKRKQRPSIVLLRTLPHQHYRRWRGVEPLDLALVPQLVVLSLCLFLLCFGATASGFAVLRPRFAAVVVGDDQAANSVGSSSSSNSQSGDAVEEEAGGGAVPDADAEARLKNKSMLVFGVFTAVRGTAMLASGFICVGLVHQDVTDLSGWGLGRKRRDLMIYTGVIMTASSLGDLGRFVPYKMRFGG